MQKTPKTPQEHCLGAGPVEQAPPSPQDSAQAAAGAPSANQRPTSSTAASADAAAPSQPLSLTSPSTSASSQAQNALAAQPDRCLWPQAQATAVQASTPALPGGAAPQHSSSSAGSTGHAAQPQALTEQASSSIEGGHSDASSSHSQASTSAGERSAAKGQARRAWPLVRHRKADGTSGVLIDKYSSVVSDSDTSDDEQVVQPAPLLTNISAKEVQSGE